MGKNFFHNGVWHSSLGCGLAHWLVCHPAIRQVPGSSNSDEDKQRGPPYKNAKSRQYVTNPPPPPKKYTKKGKKSAIESLFQTELSSNKNFKTADMASQNMAKFGLENIKKLSKILLMTFAHCSTCYIWFCWNAPIFPSFFFLESWSFSLSKNNLLGCKLLLTS